MFAPIQYRIAIFQFFFFMFVKLSKSIGVTIKFVFKKIKGFLHIGTDNVELDVSANSDNADNDLDVTFD